MENVLGGLSQVSRVLGPATAVNRIGLGKWLLPTAVLLAALLGLNCQSKCKKEDLINENNFATTQKNTLKMISSYTFRA